MLRSVRRSWSMTLAVAVAAVGLGTSAASAQTRSAPASVPAVQPAAPQAPVGVPGYSGPTYVPANTSWMTDYPANEVQAVPPAAAQAAVARTAYRWTQVDLTVRVAQERKAFERSEEYQSALRAYDDAAKDYEAARNRALSEVRETRGYQGAAAQRQVLGEDIKAQHGVKKPDTTTIVSLSQEKLRHSRTVTAMEAAALEGNSDVAAARERMAAAAERVNDLRTQFDNSVRDSAELASLRQTLRDSRIAAVGAEAYHNATVRARNIGMAYAYYLHRNPSVSYSPLGFGSYGYSGYGSGYLGRGTWYTGY